MLSYSHLLVELCAEHRSHLLEEAERCRLLRTCRPEGPGWQQGFLYLLGERLVATGEWLKQHNV